MVMDRAEQLAYVKEHLRCPHCDAEMERWDVPDNPFSDWATDHIYVCASPECPYFRESFCRLAEQGAPGGAYCFVYDPSRDWVGAMAARAPRAGPRG